MPKPPYRYPGEDILSVEWRQMIDWVEKEQVGITLPMSLTTNIAGWYTIAQGNARRASIFVVMEGDKSRHNRFLFEALWAYGGGSTERARVRELSFMKYFLRTIHGARILRDDANLVYGTAKLQVYLSPQGASVTYRIYRIDLTPAESAWIPWDLVDPPIQEDAPVGYSPHVWTVAGNGNWRMTIAETGSGATSWLTPSQMQSIFSGPTAAMDGNWNNNAGRDASLTSGTGLVADGVKFGVYSYGQANPGPRTVWLYLQYTPGGSWTQVYTSQTTPDDVDIFTYAFSSTRIYGVRAVVENTGYTEYVTEIQDRGAPGFTLYGVPYGCAVRCYDASGTLLEEKRQTGTSYVLLSVVPEKISITRPNGVTSWLEFPSWSIDNGPMNSGDVLTLYKEV